MIHQLVRGRGPGAAGAPMRVAALLVVAACSGSTVTPTTSTTTPTPTATAPTVTTREATTTVAGTTSTTTTTTTTLRPAPFDPTSASIIQMQGAMDTGALTSVALVEHFLARIAAYDEAGPGLNAVLTLNTEALSTAAALDAERTTRGPRGPLHGIPIVLKDNIDTATMATTGGSLALEGFVPPANATIVDRLEEAGAIILAKVNLHEFARDTTTLSSLGGQTLNPWDPARHPGGSSGGTSAAVSAEFAAAGIGSDTCGSIRLPAALTGLYGIRPTLGLVSTDGVIPLSPSEDTVGPLARYVGDLALLLDVLAGTGTADAAGSGTMAGARIGVLDSFFDDSDPEVMALSRAALAGMEAEGAVLVPVTVPGGLFGTATATFLQEFGPALSGYLTGHEAPVSSMTEILDTGLYLPALRERFERAAAVTTLDTAAYRDALQRREDARAFASALFADEGVDAIAYPAVRYPAQPIGGQTQPGNNCRFASVAGLPAIVVPVGRTANGLPVGLELLGAEFSEGTLIGLAAAWERIAPPWELPRFTPALPE